ncbi:MAG: lactate utilization protein [Clostridia bacterium]|nr:lactate utilization protein [Clostridia bacterium]MBQ5814001.1 lactate utilization protein [Clostridia bacterium]
MKEQLIKNLEKRGYEVISLATGAEAAQWLVDHIKDTTVGIGGCWTAHQLELDKKLGENNTVYWHWLADQVEKYGSANNVRDLAAKAEVYICSANAMTLDGEAVNIDGTGNRLASIAYGHKHIYTVVGMNKVCPDLASAIDRVRNVAAPLNSKRLNNPTPCADGVKCYNCGSPKCPCRATLISHYPMNGMPATVLLVDEALGL